jgi:hypothetical protein
LQLFEENGLEVGYGVRLNQEFKQGNRYGFTLSYLRDINFDTDFKKFKKFVEIDRRIGWLDEDDLVYAIFMFSAVKVILATKVSIFIPLQILDT